MDDKDFSDEYKKKCELIENCIKKKRFNKAFAALSVCSNLQYQWNQVYTDPVLERYAVQLANITHNGSCEWISPLQTKIIFYDGFGLDTRGLALIYLRAFVFLKYDVVYITTNDTKQPEIEKAIKGSSVVREYISSGWNNIKCLYELQCIVNKHRPNKAFFYSLPSDSVGVTFFIQMRNRVKRYQVNLTDHAFWLGVSAIDYCIEFRDYGAGISFHRRGIGKDNLILLPFYPNINMNMSFGGFNFDTTDKKIIFSGGALYKTIDKDLTYYKMVRILLINNRDLIFVYAGNGDDYYLGQLIVDFPSRVYHIKERRDLYQVMQNITLYLSTYPVTGGLMTQYAAAAGRIPVTLKFDSISDGFLINQQSRCIEYNSVGELTEDVTRLLSDKAYLRSREAKLEGSISCEEEFTEQLRKLIQSDKTDYRFATEMPDTNRLIKTYRENFDFAKYELAVANLRNLSLLFELRDFYFKKLFTMIKKLIKKLY